MNKKELLEKLRREEEQIKKLKEQLSSLKLADDFISWDRYTFEINASGDSEYPCSVKINKKDMSKSLKARITYAIRQEMKELEEEIEKLENEWCDSNANNT